MYTLAKAAHTRATSFAVAQHSFLQLLSLKMTSSFADYVDRLLAKKDSFDPDGTGMMAIDNILTMILVNGLPDEFKYMKDLMFSKDLMGEFPDFKDTLQAMITYDLNKQKVDVLPTVTVPPGPTIMSAATAIPTALGQVKCGLCAKMFNKVLRRDGKEFTNCYACSAKARETRLAAAANPTTAQVKKAQAVILAANVAAKGPTSDPIIPPPTQRERDAINNFMELQHYSMTATTIITQLHDPFCSTPAPRSLSPTASTTLSVLFSSPLQSPLPVQMELSSMLLTSAVPA
jgi:hypothetical protein